MSAHTWRKLERKPLFRDQTDALGHPLERRAIEGMLPHRDPFLLIDSVTGLDLEGASIRGTYRVREDDPVFVGHFPGNPIFPGVLQAEAIGQLGLCLNWFLEHERTEVPADAVPIPAKATRIHHARFFAPVLPGAELEIQASVLERDTLTATSAGQIYVNGRLATVAVFEVYFDA